MGLNLSTIFATTKSRSSKSLFATNMLLSSPKINPETGAESRIKGIPQSTSIAFIADIGPLLIEFTDKRHIIQHNIFGGYLPWGQAVFSKCWFSVHQ